jgi:hypothetical protein
MTKKNVWLTLLIVFLVLLAVRIVLIGLQGQSAMSLLRYLTDVSLGFFIGMAIMQLDKYSTKHREHLGDQA